MKKQTTSFFLICAISAALFSGCKERTYRDEPKLVSLQIMDRNGFSETVASKDRIKAYNNVNFLSSQPYQKVLRVFTKDEEGKSHSALTTYHSNGQIWQYLEILDGRAHGSYKEWFATGKPHISLTVIDGTADTTELAQKSWLFHETATIYDEDGLLAAEIPYEKGVLHGPSLYYHPNGALQKRVPYVKGEINGLVEIYDSIGNTLEKIPYQNGKKEGEAIGYFEPDVLQYSETYANDRLQSGTYHSKDGGLVSSVKNGNGFQALFDETGTLVELHEFKKGRAEGLVKLFRKDGTIEQTYMEKEGMKHGEEWEYYPVLDQGEEPIPKLMLTWADDALHGPVKTWYPNGIQESSKEIAQNKKHGLSFAWYTDGNLMLVEEYNNDILVKGSYFEKGNKTPVSRVEHGKGTATIYDQAGRFSHKISYEGGSPQLDL